MKPADIYSLAQARYTSLDMAKKVLALFPGQGSQSVGMGKELAAASPVAKGVFDEADHALGFSLSSICFEGPEERLTDTAIAQPAILTVSVAAYRVAKQEFGDLLSPVLGAGHSLGEYSALVAAGALSLTDAVRLVHVRGKAMQEAVPRGAGKMLAIIGAPIDQIEVACRAVSERVGKPVEIANINSPEQVVASGAAEAVDALGAELQGVRTVPLQVSAPFHCSLMRPAAERLKVALGEVTFSAPAYPIVTNVSASPCSDPAVIRTSLYDQVCGRVRWVESMQYALRHGVELAVEFGAGSVLQGLLKRIDKGLPRVGVGQSTHLTELRALLAP